MSPRLILLGSLVWLSACADGHEPNYLYRGEWIDVDGQGRSGEQTCAGSFAFVDSYAGALAREFGVEGHLGDYRWYSQARFETELPCPYSTGGCSWDDIVASTSVLHTHEVVHLTEFAATGGVCPRPLSEGLAEYFSVYPDDLESDGFERVDEALDDPTAPIRFSSYGPLGRFAAFLVARFGLDAVLGVCQTSGRNPSAEQLSAAMDSVLGSTAAELLTEFEAELGSKCDEGDTYKSRVYACGEAEAAPDIGLVSDDGVERRYTIDCANEQTIGPIGERVVVVERFDIELEGVWFVWVDSEGDDLSDVTVTITGCEPCSTPLTITGEYLVDWSFEPGRHRIEVSAPADFVGNVVVRINPG